ncbi:MAG: FMN-binding negative transcriptional regulator [Chloroflexi bacterium]|nr:FMN-binding negative transcriptional regulator [Chloroflexota bacterium]
MTLYQPGHDRFRVADPLAELARLCADVPATLVTLSSKGLVASILPMVLHADIGERGVLRGHLARGNPQWRDISPDVAALALLDGPDTYVTPAWYETKRRTGRDVPTWNYVTVQVRGPVGVHEEADWLLPHLRSLVDRHEAGRPDPWSVDDPPPGYIETHARAVVGIELHIASVEAKRKLSQNRIAVDFDGIVTGLGAGTPREQAVAAEMAHESPRDQE